MRDSVERVLKQELRILALKTRNDLKLTQKQMSELLLMNEKSYSDIETGRTSCGVLTAILLLSMQDKPEEFLDHLNMKFLQYCEKESQPVL